MYVRVLGDDGPLKMTTYYATWLPSGNEPFTYLPELLTLNLREPGFESGAAMSNLRQFLYSTLLQFIQLYE